MSLFTTLSTFTTPTQRTTISSQKLTSGTQKLRRAASKMLQKIKFSKSRDDINLRELDSADTADIQVARFVTFVRPTEAPQIIDLKAMRQNIRPRSYTHHSSVPRSQPELKGPELRLQKSFEGPRLPTETGTPLRRNPQQILVFGTTSDRSTAAVLDDVADEIGYEVLDDDDYDVDFSLLELPEKVYGILANESRHSLI